MLLELIKIKELVLEFFFGHHNQKWEINERE
jgi:hypothetical protein